MVYTPLNAGSLDKRVTLQLPSYTDDGGGGSDALWSDVRSVAASVRPGVGREFLQAKQEQPEITHQVTIRYRADVTPKYRIRYTVNGTARTFAIHGVQDVEERHEQLMLYCSEIVKV